MCTCSRRTAWIVAVDGAEHRFAFRGAEASRGHGRRPTPVAEPHRQRPTGGACRAADRRRPSPKRRRSSSGTDGDDPRSVPSSLGWGPGPRRVRAISRDGFGGRRGWRDVGLAERRARRRHRPRAVRRAGTRGWRRGPVDRDGDRPPPASAAGSAARQRRRLTTIGWRLVAARGPDRVGSFGRARHRGRRARAVGGLPRGRRRAR